MTFISDLNRKLSEKQIHTLQHSLGLTYQPYEFRNRFYTFPDDHEITPLVTSGHMERGRDGLGDRGFCYFHVTEKGRRAAWAHMPPLKAYEVTIDGHEGSSIVHALGAGKAKYEAFLNASDVIEGLSIKQFRARRCPEMDRKNPSERAFQRGGV